jgi:hypothetical protein
MAGCRGPRRRAYSSGKLFADRLNRPRKPGVSMNRHGVAGRSRPRCGWVLCIMGLAACADQSGRFPDLDSQTDADVAALAAKASAGSLATASLLTRRDAPALRSTDLIARSLVLAPDRPELIWIQWRECADRHCVDEAEIRTRLKTADPGNGLAWLQDLQDAWARQSQPEVTAVLVRMGTAPHMRIYWNPLTVMMVDALAAERGASPHSGVGADLSTRMIYSIGVLAALSIPPLQPLGKACRADQFEQPGRRDACAAMAARLQGADTALIQSFGLSIQQKWWPEGSPERAALQAEHQQLDYLIKASSLPRPLHMNRDAATRLAAARRSESETDVMRAMLAAFHKPIERPADWKDPYRQVR